MTWGAQVHLAARPSAAGPKRKEMARLMLVKCLKIAHHQVIMGVREYLPAQVSAHNSLLPPGPQGH